MTRGYKTVKRENIKITYKTGVLVSAGWRSVEVSALAEKISEKRAKVLKVLTIDGEEPTGYTSRTGAKRQQYHAAGIAAREIGKVKILSKTTIEDIKP
jgi:hypothetical protein